jgi:hypothetical protein
MSEPLHCSFVWLLFTDNNIFAVTHQSLFSLSSGWVNSAIIDDADLVGADLENRHIYLI